MNVYVLTMTDRDDSFNNGVYNDVFSTYQKALEMKNKWIDAEINDGTVEKDEITFASPDFAYCKRFGWTIDEKELK